MYRNMTNTEYRTEQMLLAKLLRVLLPKSNIKLEEPLGNLDKVDEISCKCIPDILIEDKKVVIRMNGEIHYKTKRTLKDEDQKIVLEGNGYTVIDVWFDEYPEFWDPKAYKEDQVIEKAKSLIYKHLGESVESIDTKDTFDTKSTNNRKIMIEMGELEEKKRGKV